MGSQRVDTTKGLHYFDYVLTIVSSILKYTFHTTLHQKGISHRPMGNQRTGLTPKTPKGEHRGSCSSRYPGCQWRWQPVKAKARRGDAVCLHPLSLKSQSRWQRCSDQLSEIYSVTSAPSQQGWVIPAALQHRHISFKCVHLTFELKYSVPL